MTDSEQNNGKIRDKNELESFTHSIIDSIPTALLITGDKNEVLLFNNTFVQLWQIPTEITETIDSKKIFTFLDSKLKQKNLFKNTIDYLKQNPFEAEFKDVELKNGTIIECYTLPRWIDNLNNGRVWSFRDVSQQKRAEQQLLNQKQELSNAHRIALLGSWSFNLESQEMNWSDSFAEMCEGLLIHKNMESFLSVVHPDDIEQTRNFFNQLRQTKRIKNNEFKYRIVNKKGDIYYLKTIIEIKYEKRIPVSVSGITQDITRQSLLEKSLASAKEAAEDYNIAKDNIFSNISHEMRTPLNAILGYSRILLQISGDELQKDYVKSIQASGESLLSLIEDILYISKVDKETVEISEDNVNIRNLANEVHQIFREKFKQKGIEFSINISKEIPGSITIDKNRVKQVLVNLLSNSLKFTKKGSVSVKFDGKAILYSDMFDLTIYVEDTGIGIDEKNQKKIFDSFSQIEDSAKRSHEGTGLGLYITKRNVELLGGTIKVHSALNIGSVFVIDFKNLKIGLQPIKYSRKDHHKIDTIQFQEASILVADDREFNREILRYLLSQFNFEVFEVENGKDAVLLAEKFKPSLIIMDLKMPELSGYEALKELRKQSETSNIPVVAFSSYEKDVDKESLEKKGFNGFLSKPVTFSKTIKVLCQFLDYKQIDPKTKDSNTANFNEILKDDEMKGLLKKDLFNAWKKLNKKITMKEQLEFAGKLINFGMVNKNDIIQKLGEELIQSLKLYDIDKSGEILAELNNLFKNF